MTKFFTREYLCDMITGDADFDDSGGGHDLALLVGTKSGDVR
jgi:hypothetical protein